MLKFFIKKKKWKIQKNSRPKNYRLTKDTTTTITHFKPMFPFYDPLFISRWRSLSYRNQSTDFLCKSMDWFLYDRDLRQERVKNIRKPLPNTFHINAQFL